MGFWQRMALAGYTGTPAGEVMHFVGEGAAAVQGWIDSVYHRTPVLSPWVRELGYGGGGGRACDTMDFGVGAGASATVVATYPYANQMDVPTAFDGREGPEPPPPPAGWPSGYPIHIYVQGTITAHRFMVDGTTTPIEHVWLAPGDPLAMGLLRNEFILYAHAPLRPATRYRLQATGTNGAGAVNLDQVFTTR
jgi:hypothetical protein